MKNNQLLISLFGVLLSLSSNTWANIEFQSGQKANIVLELFTSEGCSSCPPADRWLGQLKNKPQLFKEIIPMAFHVDYWDGLGWEDEYAKKQYTNRQYQYKRSGNISNVYTPGVVKDGLEFSRWYKGFSLKKQRSKVGVLKVDINTDNHIITSYFDNLTDKNNLVLNIALLGSGIISEVEAGENSGEKLAHEFVVLDHQTYPTTQKNKTLSWKTPMLESDTTAPKYAIAVWVTDLITQTPVQATGAWLN